MVFSDHLVLQESNCTSCIHTKEILCDSRVVEFAIVNEWKEKMVISSSIVEFAIVNANSSTRNYARRNELFIVIWNQSDFSFLRHYLYLINHWPLDMRYMSPASKSFKTSFFTTAFIVRFNLCWCSTKGLYSSSIIISCIQRKELALWCQR